MGIKWYYIVLLVCFSLKSSDGCIFLGLTVFGITSLEKCLFEFFLVTFFKPLFVFISLFYIMFYYILLYTGGAALQGASSVQGLLYSHWAGATLASALCTAGRAQAQAQALRQLGVRALPPLCI
jgi:hypothetical protein